MANAKTEMMTTPPAPGHFVNLFHARSVGPDDDPKFGIVMVFDKKDEGHMAFVNKVAGELNALTHKTWGVKVSDPSVDNSALKDGDKLNRPEWKGKYIMRLKTDRKPKVVDRATGLRDAEEPECYSGALYVCTFNVYAWTFGAAKKGVSGSLNNVMKHSDGEPIDGRTDPQDDFAKYAGEGAATGESAPPAGNGADDPALANDIL